MSEQDFCLLLVLAGGKPTDLPQAVYRRIFKFSPEWMAWVESNDTVASMPLYLCLFSTVFIGYMPLSAVLAASCWAVVLWDRLHLRVGR